MGTKNNYNDEWIELKNITNNRINISHWQILDKKGNIEIIIPLNTYLEPQGFYLLERTDDSSVPFVKANLIYQGFLANSDTELQLLDNNCNFLVRG